MMIRVDLYSKDDCHLCDVAIDQMKKIRNRCSLDLHIIKIREGDSHFEEFKERIPIAFLNGELLFQYRVHEKEVIDLLERASLVL